MKIAVKVLVVLVLLLSLSCRKDNSNSHIKCLNNLRMLSLLSFVYLDDNKVFPDSPVDLKNSIIISDDSFFIC